MQRLGLRERWKEGQLKVKLEGMARTGRGQDKFEGRMEGKIEGRRSGKKHMVDGLTQCWAKGRTGIKAWRRASRMATDRAGQMVERAWRMEYKGRP